MLNDKMKFIFSTNQFISRLNVVPDRDVMTDPQSVSNSGEIVGTDTESSFLFQLSPGVTDYNDKDFAALTVALEYCTQIEGLMWNRVRAPGYAYFYGFLVLPFMGVIQLQLYRCSDVVRAYNETVNIFVRLFLNFCDQF